MTAVLFAHPRCDTCRNARRWLDTHHVAYDVVDLTVRAPTPPSCARSSRTPVCRPASCSTPRARPTAPAASASGSSPWTTTP
ncbi:glutaredoxin domain-containing protein [Nannocystis pusilla]|uniref:glutaredoxin domain-containing protein n=1 Tax=Nannocystis pusilla TaxID=889268 RepID=UPI003B7BCE2F